MDTVDPIQSYLREVARLNYQSVALPPFTLFFHPSESLKYFNYAIPERDTEGDLKPVLAELREIFRQHSRVARFEFFEAFAPRLPAALREAGFIEEDRLWSMLCTPETFQPVPAVDGLAVVVIDASSPDSDVRDFVIAQQQGFDPDDHSPVGDAEIARARQHFRGGKSFLGRFQGEPAGAASFSTPLGGITEITGIATRVPYRRRGIASRLAWEATQAAFNLGVHTACLTAADSAAGRVYERIGFRPFSTMLAYIDQEM